MVPTALDYPSGDWNGFRVYRPAREGRSYDHFGGYKTINRIPLYKEHTSMAQWQDCRPEGWEAWVPEFNPRPGLHQTQWHSGKIAGLRAGRHGFQSLIPGRGYTRLNGTVARLLAWGLGGMGSRVQSQAGATPDSMAQWQDCRPEGWEAWAPEFNPRQEGSTEWFEFVSLVEPCQEGYTGWFGLILSRGTLSRRFHGMIWIDFISWNLVKKVPWGDLSWFYLVEPCQEGSMGWFELILSRGTLSRRFHGVIWIDFISWNLVKEVPRDDLSWFYLVEPC